ncbi:MAG: LemA family protein, partial [Planctomycetes bacterium]|nr:LemA family protein [Planctomycetota bacterium]
WSNVDTTLQRRLDLIPNLIETVKGYASHEKELFENLAKSREKYFPADTRAGKIEASNELSGFLSRLLVHFCSAV